MSDAVALSTPLHLGCGTTVKNRLLKSAMSEQLGDRNHDPTPELPVLYRAWARGGIGISVTGNVMVDRGALGEPGNVVLDERSDLASFEAWAEAGRSDGCELWMQLNHPGKQIPSFLAKQPVAPSAVPLELGMRSAFNPPRALEEEEILGIIAKFAMGADLAKKTGFSGVQIHCAHGYLLNQFLSPRHNRREDRWGGGLDNRMRMLLEVYRAMRAKVGDSFPVSVKLNSSDFRDGGFSPEDSRQLALTLQDEGLDLLEISGGTYENPAMTGQGVSSARAEGEAYFLQYAEGLREVLTMPLAVTGGFRSGSAMKTALESGACDVIGLARPMAVEPDLPDRLLADAGYRVELKRPSTGIRFLNRLVMLDITWYEHQLWRLGKGKAAKADLNSMGVVARTFWHLGRHAFKRRRARKT